MISWGLSVSETWTQQGSKLSGDFGSIQTSLTYYHMKGCVCVCCVCLCVFLRASPHWGLCMRLNHRGLSGSRGAHMYRTAVMCGFFFFNIIIFFCNPSFVGKWKRKRFSRQGHLKKRWTGLKMAAAVGFFSYFIFYLL